MKSGKYEDILDRIDCLANWQVFLCCRTLVVLLDIQLASQTDSLRPNDLLITDFDQFPEYGRSDIQHWCRSLTPARRPELAKLGRFLMARCLNRGSLPVVTTACATAQAPVAHLGNLQPAQIVAALGVVMSWMPGYQEFPLPQAEVFGRWNDRDGWPSRNKYPVRHCRLALH